MKKYTTYKGWKIENGILDGRNLAPGCCRVIHANIDTKTIYGGNELSENWLQEEMSDTAIMSVYNGLSADEYATKVERDDIVEAANILLANGADVQKLNFFWIDKIQWVKGREYKR